MGRTTGQQDLRGAERCAMHDHERHQKPRKGVAPTGRRALPHRAVSWACSGSYSASYRRRRIFRGLAASNAMRADSASCRRCSTRSDASGSLKNFAMASSAPSA